MSKMRSSLKEIFAILIIHFLARGPFYAMIDFVFWDKCDIRSPKPSWLAEDFLGVLLNWHASPPGYVLLHYSAIRLPSVQVLINIASSAILIVSVFLIFRTFFKRSFVLSAVLALLFMWLPSLLAYEMTAKYDYPAAALVTLLTLAFVRITTAARPEGWMGVYLTVLAFLPIFQTKFHLVWAIAGSVFFVAALAMRNDRNLRLRHLALSVCPVVPVLLVFLKNAALFGIFGATSWTGLYFGFMTHDPKYIADLDRFEQRVQQGRYTPESALAVNYGNPFVAFNRVLGYQTDGALHAERVEMDKTALLQTYGDIDPNRHFVLRERELCASNKFNPDGVPNYNHLHMIRFSGAIEKDALERILNSPVSYAKRVLASGYTYVFQPATKHEYVSETKKAIAGWEHLMRRVFLQPSAWSGESERSRLEMEESFFQKVKGALSDAMILWGALFMLVHVALLFAILRRGNLRTRAVYAFVLFTLVYYAAAVNLVNGRETERMRLYVTPVVYAFGVGMVLNRLSSGSIPSDRD